MPSSLTGERSSTDSGTRGRGTTTTLGPSAGTNNFPGAGVAGPGPSAGQSYLYAGDIGDNVTTRGLDLISLATCLSCRASPVFGKVKVVS